MRKWLVFLLFLGSMMFPARAGAQNTIKFETLDVELWSEYDKSSVLVISEFVLSKDTPLPAIVTFRFPKEANLMAVAINQNNELFNVDFDGPTEQGGWETIKITVQSYDPHRVEFYQKFEQNGKKRTFDYQWFGDYAVKDLSIGILIPSDSTDVLTDPILSSTSTDGSFFTGTATKSGLNAGQSYDFKLEYSRDSNDVINNNAGDSPVIQSSEPLGPSTEGRFSIDRLPLVIGGVGVVLILIALFFYWRSTQTEKVSAPGRRRRQSNESAEGQAYCHECGTRAHEGDRFCRVCGSRLRTNQ